MPARDPKTKLCRASRKYFERFRVGQNRTGQPNKARERVQKSPTVSTEREEDSVTARTPKKETTNDHFVHAIPPKPLKRKKKIPGT